MEKKESMTNHTNPQSETAQNWNEYPQSQQQTGTTSAEQKYSRTESHPQDNVPPLNNHHHPTMLQRPYTPQSAIEQASPAIHRRSSNAYQSSAVNRRTTLFLNQQVQQNQFQQQQSITINTLQTQSSQFLFPQPEISSVRTNYQSFNQLGSIDSNWQSPMITANSFSNETVSALGYQGGSSHSSGFSGRSSSGQTHNQLPFNHPYPSLASGHNFFSGSPSVVDSSPLGNLPQRATVRLQEILPLKQHQQWEALAAENVRLWAAMGRVGEDMASFRSRLIKLESMISDSKPHLESNISDPKPPLDFTVEGSSGVAANIAKQTSKRGRPKRQATSNSPYDSQTIPHGQKAVPNIIQAENKGLGSEMDTSGGGNGIYGWSSNFVSEDFARNVLGIGTRGFSDDGNMIKQGNKVVCGCSFADTDVPEEIKEDDEEQSKDSVNGMMEGDINSAADQAKRKANGAFGSDASSAIP